MKITLELRAAEGGDDAKLFTAQLARAYAIFANNNNWLTSINPEINLNSGNNLITIEIEGDNLTPLLNEGGGHRIQRIPENERKGRIHTSTVTVAVIENKKLSETIFDKRTEQDFNIQFYSGTGPGGQNRNKVQASARIIHIPTGIIKTAQTRSRENSVRLAMEAIYEQLDKLKEEYHLNLQNNDRSKQIGSGMRGDKRRTYRQQEDIVIDHINNKKEKMSKFMKGKIEKLIKEQI